MTKRLLLVLLGVIGLTGCAAKRATYERHVDEQMQSVETHVPMDAPSVQEISTSASEGDLRRVSETTEATVESEVIVIE